MSTAAIPEEPQIAPTGFPKLTVDGVREWVMQPQVLGGAAIIALFLAAFSTFSVTTFQLWIEPDSYYQHAPLVPFAMGYLLYHNREKILAAPIKPTLWPLPLLIAICGLQIVAMWTFFLAPQSLLFVAGLATLSLMFYGLQRTWHMLPAIGYSIMALPIWNRIIDDHTNNLQIWSTSGAYYLLKIIGMEPFRAEPTVINLPHYNLYIAAACSGMKLTLALIASTALIMMIARLKWWGNLILLGLMLPLAVAINSLRIALIGILGNQFGSDAGEWMHHYGSYGTLLLAFWILYFTAKKLGWKV